MTETKYKKPGTKNQWHALIMGLNFLIPFNGLVIMLENYLMEDRLPITYFFLIGLMSAILAGVLTFIMKDKEMRIKITGTILLLLAVIALNFLVN